MIKLLRTIQIAIVEHDLASFKDCIDKGLDINTNDNYVLDTVCKYGNVEMIKYLEGLGTDLHAKDDYGIVCATNEENIEVLKYLIKNGLDVQAYNNESLMYACKNDNIEIVKLLVENGADIHVDNDTPIRIASAYNSINVAKYLLKQGADVHSENDSPLIYAIEDGNFELVKILVENGADIHTSNEYPLICSFKDDYIDIVKYLVDLSDNVYMENEDLIYISDLDIILHDKKEYEFSKFDFSSFEGFQKNCLAFKELNEDLKPIFKKEPYLRRLLNKTKYLEQIALQTVKDNNIKAFKQLLNSKTEIPKTTVLDIVCLNNKDVNLLLKNNNYLDNLKEDILEISNIIDNQELLALI